METVTISVATYDKMKEASSLREHKPIVKIDINTGRPNFEKIVKTTYLTKEEFTADIQEKIDGLISENNDLKKENQKIQTENFEFIDLIGNIQRLSLFQFFKHKYVNKWYKNK